MRPHPARPPPDTPPCTISSFDSVQRRRLRRLRPWTISWSFRLGRRCADFPARPADPGRHRPAGTPRAWPATAPPGPAAGHAADVARRPAATTRALRAAAPGSVAIPAQAPVHVRARKAKLARSARLRRAGHRRRPAGRARSRRRPLPRQTWERAELPSGTWIAAPSAVGERRWWWIASDAQLAGASALAGALTRTDADAWRAADLAAGIPGSAPPPRICSFRRPSTWN